MLRDRSRAQTNLSVVTQKIKVRMILLSNTLLFDKVLHAGKIYIFFNVLKAMPCSVTKGPFQEHFTFILVINDLFTCIYTFIWLLLHEL